MSARGGRVRYSLASTTGMDLLRPLTLPTGAHDDARFLRSARFATVGWALVLVAIGVVGFVVAWRKPGNPLG